MLSHAYLYNSTPAEPLDSSHSSVIHLGCYMPTISRQNWFNLVGQPSPWVHAEPGHKNKQISQLAQKMNLIHSG